MTKENQLVNGSQWGEQNSVLIQLPKSVDINEFAAILEMTFETHGIESYQVKYQIN